LGVTVSWKGPLKEDDRAQQIGLVQQFVSSKSLVSCLLRLDASALVGPVKSAQRAGIPVVVIDSALKGEPGNDYVSLVATDNRRGGEMGGEELARRLGGKGKVVLLRYAEGSASTQEREEGFLAAIGRFPQIVVTVSNRYGGATVSLAQDAAMNLIDRIREADAVFCPNESTTQGMLLALRQTGLAGKKLFVGFDTSSYLIQALRKGKSTDWWLKTRSRWVTGESRRWWPSSGGRRSNRGKTPDARWSPSSPSDGRKWNPCSVESDFRMVLRVRSLGKPGGGNASLASSSHVLPPPLR
jgi:ABC-type sugar transport system substrate-binding protein